MTMTQDNIIFLLVTIFVSIPPTLGVIIAILISLNNKKSINEVHLSINSRFEQWMKMAQIASFAEGVKVTEDKAATAAVAAKKGLKHRGIVRPCTASGRRGLPRGQWSAWLERTLLIFWPNSVTSVPLCLSALDHAVATAVAVAVEAAAEIHYL